MTSKSFDLLLEAGLSDLPHDWDAVTIGQILSKDKGIAVGVMYPGDHDPSGIPLIRAGDLNGNRINPNPDFRISSEKHFEYRRTALDGGELLLSLVGNLGQCAVVTESMIGWNAARAIAVIRLSDKSDTNFVRLCLMSQPLQHLMNAWATTTVQATLNLKEIKELPIPWPPKKERDSWVATISALDDKIELNRRMNRTLESMARAVFRQWFVNGEEVNKWEIGYLSDIANVVKGVSYRSVDLVEDSDTALVTLKSMERGGGYREDGLKPYAGEYKPTQKLLPGEVVIAHTDLTQAADVIGRAARIESSEKHPNLVASLDMIIVRKKKKPYTNEYLYGLLSQVEFSDHAYGYTNGTTVLHLSTKALPEYQFRIPPKNKVEEYSEFASPIFQRIDSNKKESRTLASLWDSLLPKLMRGEVRVR